MRLATSGRLARITLILSVTARSFSWVRVPSRSLLAPLGGCATRSPIDWDKLPPDALAWAEQQADIDNEMVTVVDGDHRAEFQPGFNVYVAEID
jgi:hypothetical protein